MRCSRVQFLYEEYAAGTLGTLTAERIDLHLEDCPGCRGLFESNDAISLLLTRHHEVAHPGEGYLNDLKGRVLNLLEKEAAVGARRKRRVPRALIPRRYPQAHPVRWAGALAATILFAMTIHALRPDSGPAADGGGLSPTLVSSTALDPAPGRFMPGSLDKGVREIAGGGPEARRPAMTGGMREVSSGAPRPRGIGPSPRPARPSALETRATARFGESELTIALEKFVIAGTILSPGEITVLLTRVAAPSFNVTAESDAQGRILLVLRQAQEYWSGEGELRRERIEPAVKRFERVLELDRHSLVAGVSCFRLGDIFYDETGDFEAALLYYAECFPCLEDGALSGVETRRARRRYDRLVDFEERRWKPLEDLRQLRRVDWDEMPYVFERLAGDPESATLVPEAADSINFRLRDDPDGMVIQDVLSIIDRLEQNIEFQPSGETRAQLDLSLGDMYWLAFQDGTRALAAYASAIEAAPGSFSANRAKVNATFIREYRLKHPNE